MTVHSVWLRDTVPISEFSAEVMGYSADEPRSIYGTYRSLDYSGGGLWHVAFKGELINAEAFRYWNKIFGFLLTAGNSIHIPMVNAEWINATGLSFTLKNAYQVNAAQIEITSAAGVPLAGYIFSLIHSTRGRRVYRISDVVSNVGSDYVITIQPPLREGEDAGLALDFATPMCRMKLLDSVMDFMITDRSGSSPTVKFIEDMTPENTQPAIPPPTPSVHATPVGILLGITRLV